MIERLDDMPEGTLGFRSTGKLTAADYRDVLEPALNEAAGAGDVRAMFVVGPDFGMDPRAVAEDAKTGLAMTFRHHSALKRIALVTDLDWVRTSIHFLGWLSPGEVRVWGLDAEDEARAWVAG